MSRDLSQAISEVQAALERLRIATGSAAAASAATDWEVVSEPGPEVDRDHRVPRPPLRATLSDPEPVPSRHSGAAASSSAPVPQTRSEIASSFPDCPQYCLDLCRTLSSPALPAESRARRAWTCGCWFKAVLEGRVATPSPAPVLALRPTVYIVLRAPAVNAPCRFSTFTSFKRVVGSLEGTDTLCQLPFRCRHQALLLRRRHPFQQPAAEMRVEELGISEGSLGSPCVLKWPPGPNVSESRRFLCTPVFLRTGGLLLALPPDFANILEANAVDPAPSPLPGPFQMAAVPAAEEDEAGEETLAGMDLPLVLADMDEAVLLSIR